MALESFLLQRSRELVCISMADSCWKSERKVKKALRRAESAYQRRPNNLHVLETYAWALHVNGRSRQADAYIQKAMRFGVLDPVMGRRAAEIGSLKLDR